MPLHGSPTRFPAVGSGFSILEPPGQESAVVVEIPHAGLHLDALALASLVAPARSIAQDADLYVDDLFTDAPEVGATVLVARVSRYVCDLNRAESDLDARAAEGGGARRSPHGLVWWSTTDGASALDRPLRAAEVERRLERYHRPYHRALADLLQRKRERFGFAILLCAHSMPSRPRGQAALTTNAREAADRADIVPGSQGRTTAAGAVIDAPDHLAKAHGWSVAHDLPYRGGYSTVRYGRPALGTHALQIEISRSRYMDERQLEKIPGDFDEVRDYCRSLVARLSVLDLA